MNGLAVKDVNFNGAILRAAQDMNNIIWVGVRWVCEGLGLSEGQTKSERKKIQEDIVLKQGTKFHPLGTGNSDSEVLCLMLDFLPLWLAKIHITPKMKKENPVLVDNLVEYQLKAKDVLAEAFLGKKKEEIIPQQNTQTIQLQMPGYDEKFAELNQKIDKLYSDMGKLAQIMLARTETKSIPEKTIKNITPSESKIWKQNIYGMINRVLDNDSRFSDANEVMKYIYDYMRKNYGIVWEQEVKEYIERYDCEKKPSTIDVVYNNETFRSIFKSILMDLNENKSKTTTRNTKTADDIIKPLIVKHHDMSNAGMHTYMMVYKYMDRHYRIGWKNLEGRYINKYGAKTLSKKNMINTSPSLMKKFEASVKALLEEE